jgi:hypothetical protein
MVQDDEVEVGIRGLPGAPTSRLPDHTYSSLTRKTGKEDNLHITNVCVTPYTFFSMDRFLNGLT